MQPRRVRRRAGKGINDRGQIVANGDNNHAYLLTVVPDPETYAILLAGLGLMGAWIRRRKSRQV